VEARDASRRTREDGSRHAINTMRFASLMVASACGVMPAVAAGCNADSTRCKSGSVHLAWMTAERAAL
jgi:hypothetical protein